MYRVRNGENWQYHADCVNKITGERLSVLSTNETYALTSCIKQLSQYHTRGDSGISNKDYENNRPNTTSNTYDQDTREKKCFVETSFQDVYRMDGWQILCICEDSCTNEAETAIMFDKLWAENECKERLKIKTNRHKY
ncbi:uncharacterized protein LOC132728391 isoform X1 [Ruditapes philippinarum]|uniref:uncharacterized protein LOC132728391 isoform X1 n=1 Tax=Ruditapes philippinarum TaxID=129788 RepID=UPI00295B399A|nr:uncharacterized protein LOC132728391 isoform X1 [Ruditapes philippinarum]